MKDKDPARTALAEMLAPTPPVEVTRFRQACIHAMQAAVSFHEYRKTDNKLMRLGLRRTIMYSVALAFELGLKSLNGGHGHKIDQLWERVPEAITRKIDRQARAKLGGLPHPPDSPPLNLVPFSKYMGIHPALFDVVANRYEVDKDEDWLDGIGPDMMVFFGPDSGFRGLTRFAASTRMEPDASNTITAISDGWLVALTYWLCIMERALDGLPTEYREDAGAAIQGTWSLWIAGDGITYRDGDRRAVSVSVFGVLRENAAT
ncbi:MAG: hypothetical protein F4Y02_05450 [Chloroflexi bacterium]|nr:hypothetical protein [Chloroflexota bacterium]